jgi:predicted RNA-binding Zn-ribbon protein involved in translation (DUF1610 family)
MSESEPQAEGAAAAATLDTSAEFNCPTCGLAVPSGFSFCPRCRATAQGREYDPKEADAHERQYVFSLVVLTLGALAIPRALRSTAFTAGEKAFLALLGVANTTAVVVVLVLFGRWFPLYLQSLLQR